MNTCEPRRGARGAAARASSKWAAVSSCRVSATWGCLHTASSRGVQADSHSGCRCQECAPLGSQLIKPHPEGVGTALAWGGGGGVPVPGCCL